MKIQIKDFPNYYITDDGVVLCSNEEVKSSSVDTKGYHHISLSNNNQRKTYLIHRLVALHFIPNPNNLPQVNHIDGNKSNNNVNNLEWVTGSSNIIHSFNNNLSSYRGERNGRSKLTESQVKEIKQLIADKIKLKDIATQFNIHPNVISEIKRGIKWKHINL